MGQSKSSFTLVKNVFVGVAVTVVGGLILAVVLQQGPFAPDSQVPPEILNFEVRPETISAGEKARLAWSVLKAREVTINQGIGKVALSGSKDVAPVAPTTYVLLAKNDAGASDFSVSLQVDPGPQLERSMLRLKDLFKGDAGWDREPENPGFARVYKTEVGSGRFYMELTENRSKTASYRSVRLDAEDDFLIEVSAAAVEPTSYWYGLCWNVVNERSAGKTEYCLYLSPGRDRPGKYKLLRHESWLETLPNGGELPHGQTINGLAPKDSDASFQSAHIRGGTAPNKISVVRSGNTVRIYINDRYVNQGPYAGGAIDRIGLFVAGRLKAVFHELTVRSKKGTAD